MTWINLPQISILVRADESIVNWIRFSPIAGQYVDQQGYELGADRDAAMEKVRVRVMPGMPARRARN